MTYFTFLVIFLCIPILILLVLIWYGRDFVRSIPPSAKLSTVFLVMLAHIILALVWTTPWDNYLVATEVWWYDVALVNGMTIGYVPIEEYTFFLLQPIFTGLWLLFLLPYLYASPSLYLIDSSRFRTQTTIVAVIIWLSAIILLFSEFNQGTYLGLELVWALPPIMLQLAFGADILRNQWRVVILAIFSSTLFLSLADSIAIGSGTWTIDPVQSTGLLIGGLLPIEELVFFLLTNILIVFGMILMLESESRIRLKRLIAIVTIL